MVKIYWRAVAVSTSPTDDALVKGSDRRSHRDAERRHHWQSRRGVSGAGGGRVLRHYCLIIFRRVIDIAMMARQILSGDNVARIQSPGAFNAVLAATGHWRRANLQQACASLATGRTLPFVYDWVMSTRRQRNAARRVSGVFNLLYIRGYCYSGHAHYSLNEARCITKGLRQCNGRRYGYN